MGKVPYYTDSEETEDTSSSVDTVKKKKKLSILKYSGGNLRKKKCKIHSKSEPEETVYSHSRSSQRIGHKLRGILKHTEHESTASDDDEDSVSSRSVSRNRCLVGRVPRPAGAKPGRGGGVAIVVRKNISSVQPQKSPSATKKKRTKRLLRKQSY